VKNAPLQGAGGAWAALAACVVTIVLASGTRASFAAFLQPIEADLRLDRLTLSAVGSLSGLAYGLSLPMVGRLATRHSARTVMMTSVAFMAIGGLGVVSANEAWGLFFFAGLLPGLGYGGASNVPSTVLLAKWFNRRLGLATGIMSSAIPAGQGLFVPLAVALIPLLGWRATYLLLGLVLACGALPALWWLARDPNAKVGAASSASPSEPARAGADVWLLGAGYFCCGFTDQFVTLHLVALGAEAGIEPLVAAGFLSLLLFTGVAGSMLSGPLADTLAPERMLGGLYLLRALTLPLLLLAGGPLGSIALTVFAFVFGLTYISNQAHGARLVRDSYGVQAVGRLMGNVGLAHQVGGAAGVAVGGASVSLAANYGPAVMVAAGVALVGGLLQGLIRAPRERF
jgi:predicted MFS family arabinose efflux permease